MGQYFCYCMPSFFPSQTDFFNDPKKLSQFGYNVRKYRLVNIVTADCNTIIGQMTKMSPRKKNHLLASQTRRVRVFLCWRWNIPLHTVWNPCYWSKFKDVIEVLAARPIDQTVRSLDLVSTQTKMQLLPTAFFSAEINNLRVLAVR